MMFIKEIYAISPQKTIDESFFLEKAINFEGIKYTAYEPNYLEFIPRGLLRRMGKAVKLGIGGGLPILKSHPETEAILIGTAHGGMEDSLKFLNQIVDYNEGTLTPTNFVQSTPNSIAGVLAVMSKCTGYNITHTNDGLSFESAMLDAKLLLEEKQVKSLLLGSVEEISEYNYNIESLQGQFKEEQVFSETLFQNESKGTVNGEGSAMFFIEHSKENALAEIINLTTFCHPTKEDFKTNLKYFLAQNDIKIEDLDGLVLGKNGDVRYDFWYDEIMQEIYESNVYTFKNLVGDYPTAVSFATWLSCNILNGKNIPKSALYKDKQREVKTILIYNHFKNEQHSFILLRK